MIVQRTVNSTTKITLEKLGHSFYETELNTDSDLRSRMPIFLDSAKVFRTNAGANFYARLYSSSTADESDGTATGTENGTVSFASYNRVSLVTDGYIDWSATDNANFAQQGCVRFSAWGPASGSLTSSALITISKASGDADNLIHLVGYYK
jgi:hypothetical protein